MTTKTFAVALALLPALAGARDLRPGTLELSGGTGLDFGTATTEVDGVEAFDVSTVSLDADVLYYIVNNFGVGLGVAYDREEFDAGPGSSELSQWIVGPEAKLNLPIAPQASIVVTGSVGRVALDQGGDEADGLAFLLGGGIRFFAADFVSLDALVRYTKASVEDDLGTEVDVAGWDVGVAFSLYFGGR